MKSDRRAWVATTAKALTALYLTLTAACTSVAPWERGNLAKPQMMDQPSSAQRTVLEHVYASREAAFGRNKATGGGCGCY